MTAQEKQDKLEEWQFWYKMHFVGIVIALIGAVAVTTHSFRQGIIAIAIILGFEAFFEITSWQKRKEIERA